MEIYKDIPGYEGFYQASNKGNIKSLGRKVKVSHGGLRIKHERILVQMKHSRYLCVNLSKYGAIKMYLTHQLVAMAFLDHKPDKYNIVVDHIDDNGNNNNVENLQLISHRDNIVKGMSRESGVVGIYFRPNPPRWVSTHQRNNKSKFIGSFLTKEEAIEKRKEYLFNLKNENE